MLSLLSSLLFFFFNSLRWKRCDAELSCEGAGTSDLALLLLFGEADRRDV